jgi:hypothetical protein
MEGKLILPKMDGVEITPGIYLIGEPTPRPDLSPTSLVCLASVDGMLATIELKLKFKRIEYGKF